MKVNYINEALFGTKAQMQAKLAKDNEMSDEEHVVKYATELEKKNILDVFKRLIMRAWDGDITGKWTEYATTNFMCKRLLGTPFNSHLYIREGWYINEGMGSFNNKKSSWDSDYQDMSEYYNVLPEISFDVDLTNKTIYVNVSLSKGVLTYGVFTYNHDKAVDFSKVKAPVIRIIFSRDSKDALQNWSDPYFWQPDYMNKDLKKTVTKDVESITTRLYGRYRTFDEDSLGIGDRDELLARMPADVKKDIIYLNKLKDYNFVINKIELLPDADKEIVFSALEVQDMYGGRKHDYKAVFSEREIDRIINNFIKRTFSLGDKEVSIQYYTEEDYKNTIVIQ